MASPKHERGNSQAESSASPSTNQSSDNKHADPPPAPPPAAPPSTTTYPNQPPPPPPMYYQDPNGYPQYANGYPGSYHYPQPAPYYGPPPTYHTSGSSPRFYRSFIICSCMILSCFFLVSLALALALRPEFPIYKVASLSVTNFTTTPALAGQWNSKITIENPNDKLVAYFSDFTVFVVYKDGVVAVNHAPGFVLNTNNKVDVDVAGLSGPANVHMMEKETLDLLTKERSTGSVTFSLRVSSLNMLKSSSFSTRSEQVVAVCEGLSLVFQNNNPTGTLENKGKPVECQLYI